MNQRTYYLRPLGILALSLLSYLAAQGTGIRLFFHLFYLLLPLLGFVLPSAELPGGQDVKSRAFHVTPNVSTIRDYQPGDSFNRIHWRSTARTGQLMVKEFELDPTAEVYLVLDMQERVQQVR